VASIESREEVSWDGELNMASSVRMGRDSVFESDDQVNDLVIDYSEASEPIYSSGKTGGVWRVLGLGFEKVVSASYDCRVKIHSMEKTENSWRLSRKEIELSQHKGEVLSLAQRGSKLFSGSSDGVLCV
jgi:hypothetical protein